MILSTNLAILTFLSFLSNFLKHVRVGRYENLFIFFWKAIKIAGSAQKKTGSVGLVETRLFFLGLMVLATLRFPTFGLNNLMKVHMLAFCATMLGVNENDRLIFTDG